MTDLRIAQPEIELLSSLLRYESVSIIWDINAFYFNTPTTTYKLECFDGRPEGSDYEYDEIFFCKFNKLTKHVNFSNSDLNSWHKTIANNTQIRSLEIIETAQSFPGGNLVDVYSKIDYGINLVSLGLLINTDSGIIPAFLLPSNYGFTWHDKYGFYNPEEIKTLLHFNIQTYSRKPVPVTTISY